MNTVEDENEDLEFSLEQIRDVSLQIIPTLITLAVSVTVPILIALSGFVVLLGIAIAAYATFYYTYLPATSVSYPVFFNLARQCRILLHLYPDQPYFVSLNLLLAKVPQSMGNFLVTIDLVSVATNSTIASSSRPGYVPYSSPIVDMVRTFVQLPLLITGFRRETINLDMPLFERLELSEETVYAYVKILTDSNRGLNIDQAVLTMSAKFEGLRWVSDIITKLTIRWMMYRHRFISFFLFTAVFLLTSLICAVVVWFALSITGSRRKAGESNVYNVKQEPLIRDETPQENDYAVKVETDTEDETDE